MKQVMNYNKDNGLLNMIRRTDPMIVWSDHNKVVPFQKAHKTWKKTTSEYKKYIDDVYKK